MRSDSICLGLNSPGILVSYSTPTLCFKVSAFTSIETLPPTSDLTDGGSATCKKATLTLLFFISQPALGLQRRSSANFSSSQRSAVFSLSLKLTGAVVAQSCCRVSCKLPVNWVADGFVLVVDNHYQRIGRFTSCNRNLSATSLG